MKELKGTITALITPFGMDGAVDYSGYRSLIRFQLEAGVSGLLVLGSTAETPTLEAGEKAELIRIAVEEAGGRVPVIAGTGTYSTRDTIAGTRTAKELGADAALVVTPYYNRPSDEGLFHHFEAVAVEGGLPVIIYNIAGRTGRNITTPLLKRIAEISGIIGVKEASGDINQIVDVLGSIAAAKPDFTVMSGDDALTLPVMALGGKGVISVVSNLVPERVVQLTEAMLAGDIERAKGLHQKLLPLFRAAFIESNPGPIKAAMNIKGLPAGGLRLPLVDILPENRTKLEQVLIEAGV
ncbi:MAG: 4-hydroxy-tetrahydrodipicolinate synthase [Spirochaetaceae bacterium]|nr:4-hydroxy-tetrahydrodipicolinate synthase [Spirochaetaceae bacterium]